MSGGFVREYRSAWDHPIFRDLPEAAVFLWMVSQASWRPARVQYKGIRLNLRRGQLAISTRDLARKWKWSEAKVRRYLRRLETDAMIDARSDAGVSVITIKNYDKYQSDPSDFAGQEQDADAAGDAGDGAPPTHRRRTADAQNNEGNEGKSSYTVDFETFWAAYPKRNPHPNPKKPAARSFTAAIKSGIAAETLIAGAQRYAAHVAATQTDPKFIAQAVTWLNQGRWEDCHDAPPRPPAAPQLRSVI